MLDNSDIPHIYTNPVSNRAAFEQMECEVAVNLEQFQIAIVRHNPHWYNLKFNTCTNFNEIFCHWLGLAPATGQSLIVNDPFGIVQNQMQLLRD